jgi:hypothetical protein
MALVQARRATRVAAGIAASSALRLVQKPNSDSPRLVQSVPKTLPPRCHSVRVLVRFSCFASAGMAFSRDSEEARMTKRKRVGLS